VARRDGYFGGKSMLSQLAENIEKSGEKGVEDWWE
jgi:hypothetical protein